MRIITFVDDGIGAKFSLNRAIYVKQYFEKLGFADDKCEWLPNKILVWFGLLWDIEKGNFLLQKTAGSSGFKLVWTIFIWRKWKKKFSLKKWQKQKAKLFQWRQLLVILSDWRQGILYDCIMSRASWYWKVKFLRMLSMKLFFCGKV